MASPAPADELPLTSVALPQAFAADDDLIYRWDWKAVVVALSALFLLGVAGMRRIGGGLRRIEDPEGAVDDPAIPATGRISHRGRPAAPPDVVSDDVRVRHSA